MKNNKQYQRTSGFTLVEMAIVMTIGGILLSFMGSALLMYVEKSRVRDTEVRLDIIKESLSQYLSVNRRYPCPARFDIAPGVDTGSDPSFGREVSTDCTAGVIAGTERALSTVPPIRIGAVPVRSLNLPDDMAFDGWGRRFTYAVTENLASLGGPSGTLYTHDGGRIAVSDSTRNNFITDAHFVLVSHGRTGDGGYTFSGNQTTPCPDAATLDGENCNNDETFMLTLVNSEADAADFYDDYVAYQGQTSPPLLIPVGAIMAFNLVDCPNGWEALAAAEGKFIIGVDDDDVPISSYNLAVNTPVNSEDINISALGNSGFKNDTTMMPPLLPIVIVSNFSNKMDQRYALLASGWAVGTVFILIAIKTYAYSLSGSAAILSTLVDSITDSAISLMMLFAVRYSLKPADKDHRHGHGKIEGIAALMQGAFMAGAGVFLMFEAAERFLNPQIITAHFLGISVAIISIVMTFILVCVQKFALSRAPSLAIEADHAHYKTDIFLNIGVAFVFMMDLLNGAKWIDPTFAVLIAGYFLWTAYKISWRSIDMLMDREVSLDMRQKIEDIINKNNDVHGMHDLRTRQAGMRLHISFDVELAPDLSLKEAHHIVRQLDHAILAQYPHAEIIIHMDPIGDTDDPRHRVRGVHH